MQWRGYIQSPRQGTSHKKCGNTPGQDMADVRENDKIIVAVLSDGLGQLEYSGIAAAAVTKAVSLYLLNYSYDGFKEEWLKKDILAETQRALNECSEKLNISVSQMDCTLLFVVLFKNDLKFIYGQLGDGAICIVKHNQGLQALAFDDKFKAGSNLVKTVLSSDAYDYFSLKMCSVIGFVGFFLTTDGLENEIYSKAGRVKKKIEWYFNLISNSEPSICELEIKNRWDELTSNDKYGFTDDMSLIAIVQLNETVNLPEEANWLCACGNRNRMESTRCEKCSKDFLKVYRGINFKQTVGSKLAFFTRINDKPNDELQILQNHCEYPLEFAINELGKRLEDDLEKTNDIAEQLSAAQQSDDRYHQREELDSTQIKQVKSHAQRGSVISHENQVQHQNAYPKQFDKQKRNAHKFYNACEEHAQKKKGGHKNYLFDCFCLLLVFIIGFVVYSLFILINDNSKIVAQIQSFQQTNNTLKSENNLLLNLLSEKIELLNERITELQELQTNSINIPYGYEYYVFPSGNVYIGQLEQKLPNGIGVVYSSDILMVGNFQNGMKNGEFLFLYPDGHSEVRAYENDKYIPETETPTDNAASSELQSDNKNVLQIASAFTIVYTLIYDADIYETADENLRCVQSLKRDMLLFSNGNIVTDSKNEKWLEVITESGEKGWVKSSQVQLAN